MSPSPTMNARRAWNDCPGAIVGGGSTWNAPVKAEAMNGTWMLWSVGFVPHRPQAANASLLANAKFCAPSSGFGGNVIRPYDTSLLADATNSCTSPGNAGSFTLLVA